MRDQPIVPMHPKIRGKSLIQRYFHKEFSTTDTMGRMHSDAQFAGRNSASHISTGAGERLEQATYFMVKITPGTNVIKYQSTRDKTSSFPQLSNDDF